MASYCVKCKKHTESVPKTTIYGLSKNNRKFEKAKCKICNSMKCKFVKTQIGGDIQKTLSTLPGLPWAKYKGEKHLPGYSYCGPGTDLQRRLDEDEKPRQGEEPINRVDSACLKHDIKYSKYDDVRERQKADIDLIQDLNGIKSPTIGERLGRTATKSGMKAKILFGGKIVWSDALADELHKPVKRKFRKRRVLVSHIDDIWAADLVEMLPFSKHNKGFKYLLTVIDVFSKYGWIIPIKNKTGLEVSEAFKAIFEEGRIPKKVWSDKGKEFYNKHVKELFKKHNIELYSTENEEKSSVAERWNRTMKNKMYKYFSANSTNVYIDVLDQMVGTYNKSRHRSIKMSPIEASKKKNESEVYENLYSKELPDTKTKYKVGDFVRITVKQGVFSKGYTPNWTEEVFKITDVQNTNPPTYKLTDMKDEPIQGSFYEQELQPTTQEIFRIEKVIRSRVRDGKKEMYVKWKGYDKAFNSWIPFNTSTKL